MDFQMRLIRDVSTSCWQKLVMQGLQESVAR